MRILQIVDSMNLGGIQVAIMNVYRELKKENIQFDFIVFKEGEQFFSKEIENLGGKIHYIPSRRKGIIDCWKKLFLFFRAHKEYEVIHYHASSLTFIDPLVIGKLCGVSRRIIHAHSTNADGHWLHYYLHQINRYFISLIATDFVACGSAAAKWMYTNDIDVNIIVNGVCVDKYAYNENKRKSIRTKLGLDGIVLAHVGRFHTVKNHEFIIDILYHIKKLGGANNIRLLLMGDGPLKQTIESKTKNMGLEQNVIFLGQRSDVPDILQGADAFLLPSLFEGFPVSVIEAECVGLPCFLSDKITREVELKKNVYYLPLDNAEYWARFIMNNINYDRTLNNLKNSDIDILDTCKKWKDMYMKEKNI